METILKIKDCTIIIYHDQPFEPHEISNIQDMSFAQLYNIGKITGFEIVEG